MSIHKVAKGIHKYTRVDKGIHKYQGYTQDIQGNTQVHKGIYTRYPREYTSTQGYTQGIQEYMYMYRIYHVYEEYKHR